MAFGNQPQRLAAQTTRVQYWWNIAGWGNTQSKVESWGGVAGDAVPHVINTGQVYNIKIVNTPTNYELYFDGELMYEMSDSTQEGRGRIGLGTWDTAVNFDDVPVYGSDGLTPVDPKGKLATS